MSRTDDGWWEDYWPYALIVGLMLVTVAVVAAFTADSDYSEPVPSGPPMPCEADEVYVWADYPNSALCIPNVEGR